MLLFGYLGEISVIPLLLGVLLGFIPFLIYYYIIYKKYDTENNVHVYNAIVSKYNPDILYIPPKEASYFLDFKHNSTKLPEEAHYFLDLKYDTTKSPKKIKIFDITRTRKKHFKH
jgi:hypothetical protein